MEKIGSSFGWGASDFLSVWGGESLKKSGEILKNIKNGREIQEIFKNF